MIVLAGLGCQSTGRTRFDPYAEAGRAFSKKDYKRAVALWKVVAEREDFDYAQGMLAMIYLDGRPGVSPDYKESFKWANLAVAKGRMASAFTTLGFHYEFGLGANQDRSRAYELFSKAAELGDQMAIRYLSDRENNFLRSARARPSEAREQEFFPPIVAPRTSITPDRRKLAIVIGIENYKDLPPATFAENDARAIRRQIEALGVPRQNIAMLMGQDATKSRIEGYVGDWLKSNAVTGSTIYVYFSGHGAADPGKGTPLIVPWDADPEMLTATAIPVSNLISALGRVPGATSVAILDSCFSGAGGRSVIAKNSRPLVQISASVEVPRNVTLITSAAENQIAGGIESVGHGLFTYFLLRGMNEASTARNLDLTSIVEAIRPEVERVARLGGRTQTPRVARRLD